MSDDKMPYEDAITESAKAANNAVNLAREGGRAIGPAVGNIYGLLIGDRVAAARERRLHELAQETQKLLRDRGVEEHQEVPEDVAIPILEAAQGETREELKKLWARLLANAMDPERSEVVRGDFIYTVSKLEPLDATVLDRLSKRRPEGYSLEDLYVLPGIRQSAIRLSVEHLVKLGCLPSHNMGRFNLTDYGQELVLAVRP